MSGSFFSNGQGRRNAAENSPANELLAEPRVGDRLGSHICDDIWNYISNNSGYSVTVAHELYRCRHRDQRWQGVGYFVTDANGIDWFNIIDGEVSGVIQSPHGGNTGGIYDYDPTTVVPADYGTHRRPHRDQQWERHPR